MSKIKKSIQIDAPVERVYEFLTDPNNLPQVWPSLVEVSNVERKADGAHSFDWTYKMAGVKFEGHSDTVEVEQNRRILTKNERGIPSTFDYVYERANGGTRLTMEVEYATPDRLLAKMAEPIVSRINEHEAETLLNNTKAILEHTAPR